MFTALLIAILIVAGAATVVGGGLLWSTQRRRALERGATPPRQIGGANPRLLERGVRDMRPGDIIQQAGRDWVVEGVLHYDEDGHRWIAGRLIDVQDLRWMVIGMDRIGSTTIRVMQPDDKVDVGGYPPEVIESGGKRFQLERRGTATVKIIGDAGPIPATKDLAPESILRCRWWRYNTAGPDCIIVEQWGGDFRVLRGLAVPDDDVDLMQGS